MTLSTQFITMISMILSGIYLGASYFTFKRLERLWLSSIIWKYIFEFLFWLLQAVILYVILFLINEGVLRFYVFLAIICGYAMFKGLFEQAYSRVNDMVFRAIYRVYRFFYKTIELLIVKPVLFLITVLIVSITKVFTLVLQLIILLLRIISWPFKPVVLLVSKLFPEKMHKYIHLFKRIYSKIRRNE